ncbi:hypothetical protein MNY66_00735 [Moellerella wisconsensis]|uniref:hypothetical protein n=1 Tax=Moellerella wisconsensis TaxID=158849 RepID=UPI001F4D8BE2|nr:hypothetical protein [Moellerella wisconsensis]UNH44025.1 hypothetical protein MNY66_00735 [Moellerella wisconsensis]
MTKWAPYIDFSHEYSPINYPILQVNHRIEYMTLLLAKKQKKMGLLPSKGRNTLSVGTKMIYSNYGTPAPIFIHLLVLT